MLDVGISSMIQRPGLRQFVKFCLIGLTSMVIDVGIARYLTYEMQYHWILAQVISFALAVTNGFVWNSLWTFRGLGSGSRHAIYLKFVGVNVLGLLFNLIIMKGVFFAFTGHIINQGNPDKTHWAIAKGIAIVLVAIWNFQANKHYTFRPPDQ